LAINSIRTLIYSINPTIMNKLLTTINLLGFSASTNAEIYICEPELL